MIRLLGNVRLAYMLDDDAEHGRLQALLDGFLPHQCDGLAHELELEALRLRPALEHSPSAPERELAPRELAPAGDLLSDLGAV